MPFVFHRLYRRLGRHYILLFVLFDALSALIVCVATVGMFSLYTSMSTQLEPRGEVPLKGKSDPVTVYAPQALDERLVTERLPLTTEA